MTYFQVQLHFDRRLQDIKRKISSSNHHDEEKIPQVHIEPNKHRVRFLIISNIHHELLLQNTKQSFEGNELKTQQVF